jgi:hypothetical protein
LNLQILRRTARPPQKDLILRMQKGDEGQQGQGD